MRTRGLHILLLSIVFFGCNETDIKLLSNKAYEMTEEIVAIGPRDPGSKGIEKTRKYLRQEVSKMGFVMREQHFDSNTPVGKIPMKNLYFDIPGQRKETIILGAHYDSKRMGKIKFVGANDAASSVALLLSLAPWIKDQKFSKTVRIVFFDGEEALVSWSSRDSLYGSKAYAQKIPDPKSIKAAVVVDMISDENLKLIRSRGTSPELLQMLEDVLGKASLEDLLDKNWMFVEDDHTPFVMRGISTLHLMDFTFGGDQSPGFYWHTEKDDMSRVSKKSLQTMVKVMMMLLPVMDAKL